MNLNRNETIALFNASVDNANYLVDAAHHLVFEYNKRRFPALGLAELALEELGKAYTLLAYLSRIEAVNWKQFEKEWRNHNMKAHRGYFYEFFCLLRIEVHIEGYDDAFKLRDKFSDEKEASFYVDINRKTRKILIPSTEITDDECRKRVLSIYGLLSSALYIKDWINSDNEVIYKNAISDFAFVTITEDVMIEDVETIISSLRKPNEPSYNKGLDEIWNRFNSIYLIDVKEDDKIDSPGILHQGIITENLGQIKE